MLKEFRLHFINQNKDLHHKHKSNYILDSYSKFTSSSTNRRNNEMTRNSINQNNKFLTTQKTNNKKKRIIQSSLSNFNISDSNTFNINNNNNSNRLSQINLKNKKPRTSRNISSNHRRLNSCDLKSIRKEYTKSYCQSIESNIIPDDYRENYYNYIDNDFNDLKSMINSIKENFFYKFQNEFDNKIQLKNQLENSISFLKSQINMYNTQKKNFIL